MDRYSIILGKEPPKPIKPGRLDREKCPDCDGTGYFEIRGYHATHPGYHATHPCFTCGGQGMLLRDLLYER